MTADDEHGGMIARCPNCQQEVRIPADDAEAAEPVVPIASAAPEETAPDLEHAPADAAGSEEALLFAEQMGLEVEAPAEVELLEADGVSVGAEPETGVDYGLEHGEHAELLAEDADTSMAARAARAARSHAAARRKAQFHFKKAAIPLMLALSGLLLIFAVWSLVDLAGGAQGTLRQRAMLMMLSWPVVAILLFGAAWFYRDIRKAEQE